jgi:hypothetical protein
VEITVEGATTKELFKSLSAAEEVFATDRQCGLCESDELRHRVRQTADYEFFELVCMSCFATMPYGQRKSDGQLFPRRKGEDGKTLPNKGWAKRSKEPPARPRTESAPADERRPSLANDMDPSIGF